MLVEVIACSLVDAVVARDAGADRVELCLAIEVGGLTPYIDTIIQMKSVAPFPVVVMVRPQSGGFVYEKYNILAQIARILSFNLSNVEIITGALTEQNELDLKALTDIRALAKDIKLTCHRCFDLTPDPFVALEQLIDLGFDRVLTSGQAKTALEGADVIARLVEQANGRIEIIAGSGVRPHNVQELISRTGVTQVHASCFADVVSTGGPVDFGPTLMVSSEKVRALVDAASTGSLGFQPG
ncbi:MAG: copper homeostasis protein CutC [Armatimonadota bacterium]